MKFITLTISFVTLILEHAIAAENKNLLTGITAKDVGDVHNKIMDQVDKRMRENIPTEYDSYIEIATEEMLTLCGDGDEECEKAVNEALHDSSKRVMEHQLSGKSLTEFDMNTILPDELDDETRAHFESIHDALSLLKDDNMDDVLSAIDEIVEKVENGNAHDVIKTALVSVASVASGSTKYWMNARTDPENNFRRLQNDHTNIFKRSGSPEKSLLNLLIDPVSIAVADFIGAVVGSIDPIIDYVLAGGIASPFPIFFGVVLTSAGDSITSTGIIIPAASVAVRCFLEDQLTSANCSIRELFCSETDICK